MHVAELLMRLILIGVLLLEATTAAQPEDVGVINKPGCEDRCGNVSIPYPFGTSEDCYHDEQFRITCKNTSKSTSDDSSQPQAFIMDSNVRVINISIEGKLRIVQFIARDCYESSGARIDTSSGPASLTLSKFIISDTDNKFVAVGCDTQASIQGYQANQRICYYTDQPAYNPGIGTNSDPVYQAADPFTRDPYKKAAVIPCSSPYGERCFPTPKKKICYDVDQADIQKKRYTTGCITKCGSKDYVANYSCSGLGCCQTSIPKGMSNFTVTVSSYDNHTEVSDFNPCSYAFVVEVSNFNFSLEYLSNLHNVELPAVLDWSIGNETCQEAQNKTASEYACKGNTICIDPENGSGYLCECAKGYHGNPYLGCQDIDECNHPNPANPNECVHNTICKNTNGNYTCSCPKGYNGDGRKTGDGCIANPSKIIEITVGVGVAIMVLIMGSTWFCMRHKKRKLIKLKEKCFLQNGGLILQQRLTSSQEISPETTQIFTAEELEKATNNYDENRIVGKGSYGTVYKGDLAGGQTIAIKKSKIVDQGQIGQFIKEVIERPQINHTNVVKLLGCCLETEVPLLVYEFATKGTLFDLIHNSKEPHNSWETRLRIAAETAGVLSKLHSLAPPIIHKDVKSANILLDNSYKAKVYDFRASRLVPVDQAGLSTMVEGTIGYLDPEYFQTSQLTEKSDVYSFGVVLVELLTGKKALDFNRPEKERNLSMYFLSAMKEDRLSGILEERIVGERSIEHFKEVANIAETCLRMRGEERPAMKDVAKGLNDLCRA